MPASTHDRNTDSLTYEQWLAGAELPEGFRSWQSTHDHWRRSHPLGWAIHCYKKSKAWRKLQWQNAKAARNAAQRPTPS